MNHEDAFLRSISEDADDVAPRLVFADWLDDNGDPQWARFIRVQCRLAKLGEDDPERQRLAYEAESLLPEMLARLTDRKHPRYAAKLATWLKEQRPAFERGFVARLSTTPRRFLDRADELMKVAPIQHLNLNNAAPTWGELLASPHLPRIRSLTFNRQRLSDAGISDLIDCPGVAGLTSLDLTRNRFRIEGATALANCPHLSKLERLVLGSNRIHDRGPEALANSPHLSNLKQLDLADCLVGPRGATALANSPHLGKLERLDLSYNHVADAGARALADSAALANLTWLDVTQSGIEVEGRRALLGTVGLKRLTTLCLDADGDRFWEIMPADHLRGRLDLRTRISSILSADWRNSPLLAGCAALAIHSAYYAAAPPDETAAELTSSPATAGLRALDLTGFDLTDKGILAVARSTGLTSLRRLTLSHHRLRKEGLGAFLKAPLVRQLTHLELMLWGNSIDFSNLFGGVDGVKLLLEADGLDHLTCLRVAGVKAAGRQALRERFGWRVAFE
jgi:uncharacterized protein (TIGR02996 family)